ncbi:unnamed protein product, partial [Scytosiphon promiscuus]
RSHVLHKTLSGFVQRRDVTVMAKALPKDVVKEEIVLTVTLSDSQKALTRTLFRQARATNIRRGMLLRIISPLQLLWTHP